MSRRMIFPILILTAGSTLLYGQAMIEYGATAGHAGATAGAAPIGKSVVGIFDKVNKSLAGSARSGENLKPSAPPAATTAVVTPVAKPAQPEPPAAPPDLTALAVGMDRADLLKKVGKPSMSMSSVESSVLVETCWYRSDADNVTVILRNGKVASISGLENLAAK